LAKPDPLLRKLRSLEGLAAGSFDLKANAFLHFHEDALGLFADLKEDFVSFRRYPVTTRDKQQCVLLRVNRCLQLTQFG